MDAWMASGLPRSGAAVTVVVFEVSPSALRFSLASLSSRLRLAGEVVVVDPFGCSFAVESWFGILDDSAVADATRSLCLLEVFRIFRGRLLSRYLRWSS